MKIPRNPTLRAVCILASALASLVFAATGCGKKAAPPATAPAPAAVGAASPAELAKRPEHEQLMAYLEDAQRQRLEVAQARANARRLKHSYDTAKKAQAQAHAAAAAELVKMHAKFKAAETAANGTGAVSVEHDGVTYSAKNYSHLIAQKRKAQKSLAERAARLNEHHVRYDADLQKISLQLDALASREQEVRANISELLLGREISGLKDPIERMRKAAAETAAVTQAVVEMQKRPTLLDTASADITTTVTDADLADAEAFLNAK